MRFGGQLAARRGAMFAATAVASVAIALTFALALRPVAAHASAVPATCDSYGTWWVKWFNRNAVAAGNPTRMVSACCETTSTAGVHHCYIKVTLAGTTVSGCATYDLGKNGLPVSTKQSIGQHQNCAIPKK